jgi:hypothetical protein
MARMKYRTRSLRGSLLVIKGLRDCATIERDKFSDPVVVSVEGDWTPEELKEAMRFWKGSAAQKW